MPERRVSRTADERARMMMVKRASLHQSQIQGRHPWGRHEDDDDDDDDYDVCAAPVIGY